MSEANKQAARRLFEEGFNQGNVAVADEIFAADAVDHDPSNPFPDEHGPEGAKKAVAMYREAFPDLRITVEQQIADGDFVVTRWTSAGTHEGDLMGIPSTGIHGTSSGITMDRFENGMIAETWTHWDTLGLMQQLGAIPQEQPAG
jgi:steroid delta-isomerase-like uncharacterized protein